MKLLFVLGALKFSCAAALNSVPPLPSNGWEAEVIGAWQDDPNCLPDTGLCDKCGLGTVIVEVPENVTGPDDVKVRMHNVGMKGKPAPWGPDDTWETASVSKLFTAILMWNLESDGLVYSNMTIGELLPCDFSVAVFSPVATITLLEMAMHHSGLPPQPPNRGEPRGDLGQNPFAFYTEEMLCSSLLELRALPTRGRYYYSNYAYGTLGYALTLGYARATGAHPPPTFEELMIPRVLDPLGMHNTRVTYANGFNGATPGCDRDPKRGSETMRTGPYGVIQGNGALRSTLRDMAKFLQAYLAIDAVNQGHSEAVAWAGVNFDPKKFRCFAQTLVGVMPACTCVSGFCEGNMCPLPNTLQELITPSGVEEYTSGDLHGWRKSGDTAGYSLRVAWSYEKRRAALAIDTCGGCGSRGTSGSAAQRLALILADGPPDEAPLVGETPTDEPPAYFSGRALSHNAPSEMILNVTVDPATMQVHVGSSDSAGGSVAAVKMGDGFWTLAASPLYGQGFGSKDPLAKVAQKRSIRYGRKNSGIHLNNSARLQEMGADIYLAVTLPPN